MKVVSNSSVLISLSAIGQLDLLHTRFPAGVLIPRAVWQEVVETGQGRSGAQQVASASWIQVVEALDSNLTSMLRIDLDAGEAEAIVLAREQQASTVLLDEKDARRVARKLGLFVLGTVGVLIWAKRAGQIADLRSQLDALQQEGKFRLSKPLYLEALEAGGEHK